MIELVKKFRAVIDELMRTPYLRSLEQTITTERAARELWVEDCFATFNSRVQDRDALIGRLEQDLQRERAADENELLQLRQDLTARIRDKDQVIADLRLRLAVAEADTLREQEKKIQASKPKPVPDWGGPVPYQDALGAMALEKDEVPEETQE